MNSHLLSVTNYNIKTWYQKFPDFQVNIENLKIHHSWKLFFENIKIQQKIQEKIQDLNSYLSYCLLKTEGKINIFPYPDLIFNALNITSLDNINVVILGQDPYHGYEIHNGQIIPQAMGLSFSVPKGIKIPSSLENIYSNLMKFDHIKKKPSHGNLSFWAYQGCLLLNTSLTVQEGNPNSHQKYWNFITDQLIKFISEEKNNIVFALWGNPALNKLDLIDQNKHKIIISSHPSGLSYCKPLKHYKPFCEVDHFGKINKYLIKHGKNSILWQII